MGRKNLGGLSKYQIRVGVNFNGPAVGSDGSVYILGRDGEPWALSAFDKDGTAKEGWPYRFPFKDLDKYLTGLLSSPSVASDGTIYVGMTDTFYWDTKSYLYAFTPSGSVKAGWPIRVRGGAFGAPSIALDGTVYFSLYWNSTESNRQVAAVHAFTPEGERKPGWPRRYPDSYSGFGNEKLAYNIVLDANGNSYFGVGRSLYGYSPDGRLLPGYPLEVSETAVIAYLALARDGVLYFVGTTLYEMAIYAVKSSGESSAGPQ